MNTRPFLLYGVVLCLAGCRPAEKTATVAAPSEWFVDRTVETGLNFTHLNGMTGDFYYPEVMPPGVALLDFDNDGDLDVFVGQNVGEQWIYENNAEGSFTEHCIAVDSRGHEARVGDVDCDGDLDIAGKPWGQENEGGESANPPRDHVYLQNMLVERGGTPRFERGPHEILPATRLRSCP